MISSKIQHTLRMTEELNERIQKKRSEKLGEGKTYPSMNEILIELLETSLNGDSPPSVPDSEPKNVSTGIADTFEKQSKEFDFNFDE